MVNIKFNFKSQIVILVLMLMFGCDHQTIISKPFVSPSNEWEMVEDCGTEACNPLADYLIGDNVKIRIDTSNHYNDEIFTIDLLFYSMNNSNFYFDPTKTKVTLNNGEIIQAKPFYCRYTIRDIKFLREKVPVTGSKSIDDNFCFRLFFDTTPPSVDETFEMKITGLTKGNTPIDLPTIFFNKGIKK